MQQTAPVDTPAEPVATVTEEDPRKAAVAAAIARDKAKKAAQQAAPVDTPAESAATVTEEDPRKAAVAAAIARVKAKKAAQSLTTAEMDKE